MKFGLVLPHHGAFASRDSIETMVRAAEDGGYDSVWCADHVIIPRELVNRFSATFYEVFTTLAYVAGITSRVKLGTTVLVLPYRHPVTLAKEIATLDQLCDGRVIAGAAFGWVKQEYEVLGVPFARRGRRADEMLEIFDLLWSGADNNAFDGEFYRFGDFAFAPLPVQKPRPPIWIGGNNERALERVVKYGDGWHPITSARRPGSVQWSLADLRKLLARLDELATEAGRDPRIIARSLHAPVAFDVDPKAFLGDAFGMVGSVDTIRRNLDAAREIGLDHIVLNPWYTIPGRIHEASLDTVMRTVDRFTNEVLPAYALP